MFNTFASSEIEIHVASGKLFELAGFPITNSLFTGFISLLVLLAVFGYVVTMIKRGKYNRFIGLVQWAFEGMLGQIESVVPDKKVARQITPLALTIFFFMMISYWMSVLPGLDSVFYNDVPVLRALPADLNFTFAVAIIVFITVQYHAIRALGPLGNLGRYFRNPLKDPIGAFEGVLEFIGFVQAYVFFILTVIFTSLAIEHHGPHESDHSSDAHAIKKADVPA